MKNNSRIVKEKRKVEEKSNILLASSSTSTTSSAVYYFEDGIFVFIDDCKNFPINLNRNKLPIKTYNSCSKRRNK